MASNDTNFFHFVKDGKKQPIMLLFQTVEERLEITK